MGLGGGGATGLGAGIGATGLEGAGRVFCSGLDPGRAGAPGRGGIGLLWIGAPGRGAAGLIAPGVAGLKLAGAADFIAPDGF